MKSILTRYINLVPLSFLVTSAVICISLSCRQVPTSFTFSTNDMASTFHFGEIVAMDSRPNVSKYHVVVFTQDDSLFGYRLNEFAALRAIGMPGNRIYISGGRIWINKKLQPVQRNQKRGYVTNVEDLGDYNTRVQFVQSYSGFLLNDDYALINLDSSEYSKLKNNRLVEPLESFRTDTILDTILINKVNITIDSKDTLPEIYIPRKGDTLTLDDTNRKYYKHGTKSFTSLGGNKYIANENMYFVVGDNWIEATDSRHFGLINESAIVGTLQEPKLSK